MTTVVVTPTNADMSALAVALMPGATQQAQAYDRVYRLYRVDGVIADSEFRDVDGDVLVLMRSFPSEEAAKAWVQQDVAQRGALLQARRVAS